MEYQNGEQVIQPSPASVGVTELDSNIDASGKGFDADKVDGQHASAFEPANANVQSHISKVTENPHSVTKDEVGLNNVDNTSDADKPVSTSQQVALDLKVNNSEKGSVNGIAELDGSGNVPASQLPSYVDSVVEYANLAAFPGTGETSKIYIALDTNITYRWSGTVYAIVSDTLALGETLATAYRGDRGKLAYDHSQGSGSDHSDVASNTASSHVQNSDTILDEGNANEVTALAIRDSLDADIDAKERSGLPNQSETTMEFVDGTLTFILSPVGANFNLYISGKKYTKSAESKVISDVTGLHYIYYGSNAVLQESLSFWDLEIKQPVAIVYWNTNNNKGFILEERHLFMWWKDHKRVHLTQGTQYLYGFGASGYTYDSDIDTDVQFGLANGAIIDEDIEIEISNSATPSNPFEQVLVDPAKLPVYYLEHDGTPSNNVAWVKDAATVNYFKYDIGVTDRVQYNNPALGAQVIALDKSYVAMFVFATGLYKDGEGNILDPIIAVQGQREDASLVDAIANNTLGSLTNLVNLLPEFKLLYIAFLYTRNTFTNTGKCQLRLLDDKRNDVFGGIVSVNLSSHSTLGHLDYQVAGHTNFGRLDYNNTTSPTPNNDGIDTAGLGRIFRVGDSWINTRLCVFYKCVDNSAGAAKWLELACRKEEVLLRNFYDFKDSDKNNWASTVLGGGANATVETENDMFGEIRSRLDATSDEGDYALFRRKGTGDRQVWLGKGIYEWEFRVRMGTLMPAASPEDYYAVIGIGDTGVLQASISFGVYFEYYYNGAVLVTNAVTEAGNTKTITAITNFIAGNTYHLGVKINAAGTSVEFYVNDVLVATHTTNIDTTNNHGVFTLLEAQTNNIGINADLYHDWFDERFELTTRRSWT